MAVASILATAPVAAFRGGLTAQETINPNRVTINTEPFYANLAKGFAFPPQNPTTVSSDGYPLSAPSSNIGANPSMPAGFYSTFVWKWVNQGSMELIGGPPTVFTSISPAGAVFNLPSATSGDLAPQNIALVSQSNPRMVFFFGWNIQSITMGSGGVITVNTKTNYVASGSGYTITTGTDQNGNTGRLVNIAGANSNTGANGTWAITNLTASSFDLVGSAFTNGQASAAGTGTFAAANLSVNLAPSGTYSGMAGLVWCRSSDETAIANGQIADTTYIGQLQYLANQVGTYNASRMWLRNMDLSGAQQSFESDFSQRIPSSFINYPGAGNGSYRPGYWTGSITNGGSDNYTAADPSISTLSGGSYIDNAIVQGTPTATNAGGTPTLAVGSGPAKPIFNYRDGNPPFILAISSGAPNPGTDVLQYTFSATWLNGGSPYVFNYTTTASGTFGCAHFGSDATLANLIANLDTCLAADATLAAAKVFFINPQGTVGPFLLVPTAQSGRLSITYTSGPAIAQIWNIRTSQISATEADTFIYNYLLDGWIYYAGPMVVSVPFEYIVNLANSVGAHVWYNWGTTKGAWITAVTNFISSPTTGLTSGLRFGNEAYNEIWNTFADPYAQLQPLGVSLGWTPTSFTANQSYTALKTIQYSALAKAAWLANGRSASDFYIFNMSQTGNDTVGSSFDVNQLRATNLNTATNTVFATYGGLNGGTVTTNYAVSPNRPADTMSPMGVGFAPYWGSPWWSGASASITGTVTVNAPWLQASLTYTNGNPMAAFASLVDQFNGTTLTTGVVQAQTLGNGTPSNDYYHTFFTNKEAQVAQYDASRATLGLQPIARFDYEGGPQFGPAANSINGVNSVNSTDINALASRITTLGWNVSPYTADGTNNATEVATQVITMVQAWKYDLSYDNLIKTSYYNDEIGISATHRETHPAQYGYNANTWGFFPSSIFFTNQYMNYNAVHEFNFGG